VKKIKTDSPSRTIPAQRKQTEPAHNSIDKKPEKVDRLLQMIIDAIEGEVFVKDAHGKYLFVNKTFGEDFGVDPKEVIGKDDVFVFGTEIARQLRKNDQCIMGSKKAETIEERGTLKGKDLTYSTRKVPLIDEEGTVIGICGVGYDVTQQVQMKEKIKLSEERYQNLIDFIP